MNYLVGVDGCFVDRPSGSARVAWDIALMMRDRGHAVTLVCPRQASSPDVPPLSETDGIEVLRYDRPHIGPFDPRRAAKVIAAGAEAVRKHLGGRAFDTVHLHNPFTGTAVADAIGPGPRYVYTVHSPTTMEQRITWGQEGLAGRVKLLLGMGTLRRIEKSVLLKCDLIHTLSKFTRVQLDRIHGPLGPSTVIPHWAQRREAPEVSKTEARRKLGWPIDRPVLFTLRRHVARMGLDVAIDAIAPLAREDRCALVISGDGPLRAKLEAQAAARGASREQIRFTGRISDEHLELSYLAADLFVLPTTALECFGLITIEAMAFGCPVVGTDAGATLEILNQISPELAVTAGDADDLRERIAAVIDGTITPPAPSRLRQFAAEQYGFETIAAQLAGMLEGPIDAESSEAPQADQAKE